MPNAVRITARDKGGYHLLIDGHDIANAVRGLTLNMNGWGPHQMTVHLNVHPLEEVGEVEAHVVVQEETAKALIALGWTPPADEPTKEG